MRNIAAAIICCFIITALDIGRADAGSGRFLAGLLARGVASGVARGVVTQKTYGPDVLSVQQLTECLRKADQLDKDSSAIELDRGLVQTRTSQIDALKAEIERTEATLNRRSQAAIDQFNAMVRRYNAMIGDARTTLAAFNQKVQLHNGDVDAYNGACAKRYYADDLEAAKRTAGLQ